MLKTDVLILGGGLAGLSAAYHLNQLSHLSSLIVEKKATCGGTAGSVVCDEFVFDYTGHLLHLHDPYGKALIENLLRGNWALHDRSAWIWSCGVFTRYPFQANTCGLPQKVIEECVTEFLKTVHAPHRQSLNTAQSFQNWCLRTFGAGISRHFMFPYNKKLWRLPLTRMTTEWQGRFVPKPTPTEVVCGALSDQSKLFGYNAAFRYPIRGGIQALPNALAARLPAEQIRTCAPVLKIDLREQIALVEGIGEVSYGRLINTLPLVDFIDLAGPWPHAVHVARAQLRYNTVHCLNLGISRDVLPGKHWVYFPEDKYPFYRVGCASHFSRFVAPKGAASLYIEVSRRSNEHVNLDVLEKQILNGLRSCGILRSSDRLLAKMWMPVRCGYVIYDFNRSPAVRAIFKHLGKRAIFSIGRYGGWKYSFMEETILDGLRCAEAIAGRRLPAASSGLRSSMELIALK